MHLIWIKSDYIIPADTGGKIRTYNLMKQLNKLCDVTYLSLKNDDVQEHGPEIRECASRVVSVYRPEESKQGLPFYRRILARMPSRLPFTVQKYRSREIRSQLQQCCHPASSNGSQVPTVILCDFLEMAENVIWDASCPKILFQHNVENVIWKRYAENETSFLKKAYFQFEYNRMHQYERMICDRFDMVLAVSEQDKRTMVDQMGVQTPVEVIETGVDVEYFDSAVKPASIPGRLLFLGSMDWMPNIDAIKWFLDTTYRQIKSQNPQVTLDIVGRRPTAEIQNLVAGDESIRLIADVPDVRPYIASCELFIVPLRIGGGSRIKIYEAMAMHRPVLSTTVGAEGLPLVAGRDIEIADTPQQFGDATIRLLNDAAARSALSDSAYQLVSQNFDWSVVARRFYELCLSTCN